MELEKVLGASLAEKADNIQELAFHCLFFERVICEAAEMQAFNRKTVDRIKLANCLANLQ